MATMTIRCDEKDKQAAQEVAEYYGFDLSSVTRAFWKQMAHTLDTAGLSFNGT